ncbi:hypothetical protein LSO10F_10073 [Candidatus Liberibacter solanacearum]
MVAPASADSVAESFLTPWADFFISACPFVFSHHIAILRFNCYP